MTRVSLGRWILTGVAVLTATGGFLADWNETHLFNPRWTPHAKFHDAWTLLLGAGLGALSLRALWKEEPDLELAAQLSGLFWAGQGGCYAFPGTAGIAGELPDPEERRVLSKLNEGLASAGMLALTITGYALARQKP